MSKKYRRRKNANSRLSSELTDSFIYDLQQVIDDDLSIRGQYLKKYWLTKFADPSPGSADKRRSAAIEKWLLAEERNKQTNTRLLSKFALGMSFVEGCSYSRLVHTVRGMVARVIPWTPSLDIAYGGFSGGASTSRRRAEGHPALKFRGKADTTRDAWPIFQSIVNGSMWDTYLNESRLDPRFQSGNHLFTVPKNSEIDRCACKEPDINLFLQKMLGNQIRWCLRRVGIDLNDQSINAHLARDGSITGGLTTIDLSSASDSMTKELVTLLMPTNWLYYLEAFRSPTTIVDEREVVLEMFSSMGNGFTFELESLLFYSIAKAVAYLTGTKGRVSVYGDDIIAPTEMFEALIRALNFFGFRSNLDKTFNEGPFRESCGSYWHAGENVKPFFLKTPILRLTDLIKVLNQLTSWSSDICGIVDPRYGSIIHRYKTFIPTKYWGGQDVTSITSLVTGDGPRRRLKLVDKTSFITDVGGYLYWSHSALSRVGLTADRVRRTSSANAYECRKNLQARADDLPILLEE